MNIWQVAQQLKYILGKRKWADNPVNELVFGSVKVVFSPAEVLIQELRVPTLFIIIQSADTDSEEPNLITQNIDLKLVNMVRGDNVGEDVVMGSNRSSTKSDGRGLLEIEEELLDVVSKLNELYGIKIIERFQSSGVIDEMYESGYTISRTYSLKVYCINNRTYGPAMRLMAPSGSAKKVQLTWKNPADRFDRKQLMIRRANGTTPPPTISDGVQVLSTITMVELYEDSGLTTGQKYSYSLFVGYDEYGIGTASKWSEPICRTVTVT